MITKLVSYCRSNETHDIFKLVWLDEITHWSQVDYAYYPRSMNLTEDDVYALEMIE